MSSETFSAPEIAPLSGEKCQPVKVSSAPLRLRAGDLVVVRTPDEILKTLDANGTLDNLPFMPEMLKFCGKRFRVMNRVVQATIDGAFFRPQNRVICQGIQEQ